MLKDKSEKYCFDQKENGQKIYIGSIVIHCSHESETSNRIVFTSSQGEQKIGLGYSIRRSALVYQ